MPIKALHLCNKAGCTSLTRERYCSKHIKESNRYNSERTDSKYTDFSKTTEGKITRGIDLARDN